MFGGIYCAEYYPAQAALPEPTVDLPKLGVVVIMGGRPVPWNTRP